VVNKKFIYSEELRNKTEGFYSYMIKTLLIYSADSILNARIKIDGSGNRFFRRSFLFYLRKQLNYNDRRILKNCKLVNSKNNVLIQMADMIAGSIRRSYDDKRKDRGIYKRIIARHIEDEWKFK